MMKVALFLSISTAFCSISHANEALDIAGSIADELGYTSSSMALKGVSAFDQGGQLATDFIMGNERGLWKTGGSVGCSLLLSRFRTAGEAIAVACGELAGLAYDLAPEPVDRRRQLELVMEDIGISWDDYPKDLRYATTQEYYDYQIEVLQDVIRREQLSKGLDMPNAFLNDQLHDIQAKRDALASIALLPEAQPEPPVSGESDSRVPSCEKEEPPQFMINSCLSGAGGNPSSPAYHQCVQNIIDGMDCIASSQNNSAVQRIIEEKISYGCNGPGTMSDDGMLWSDLDMDGDQDLLLNGSGISCSNARPIFCGVRVCSSWIYFSEEGGFIEKIEILNEILETDQSEPPRINLMGHDLKTGWFQWGGTGLLRAE